VWAVGPRYAFAAMPPVQVRPPPEAQFSFFSDAGKLPDLMTLAAGRTPVQSGCTGKPVKLTTNSFALTMSDGGGINHYTYAIEPACTSENEEREVLTELWPKLAKELNAFVVHCPKSIFSPTRLENTLVLHGKACTLTVDFHQQFTAQQVNSGTVGEAQVVFRHILKNLCKSQMYQKVGRRFFNNDDAMSGKSATMVFRSFYSYLGNFGGTCCPHMHIDASFRAVHRKTMVEYVAGSLDGASPWSFDEPSVAAMWREKCVGAIVVTSYNNRIYRIKDVRFDLTPRSELTLCVRDDKNVKSRQSTFVQYYQAYYQKELTEFRQPLLEAIPDRRNEQIFLVPEFCCPTGFNDDIRKDKATMQEVIKTTKLSPSERFVSSMHLAGEISKCSLDERRKEHKLMQDWSLKVSPEPTEVEGRQLEALQVDFGKKAFQIEEGNFQRWMRNGLQCSVNLYNWLFIYPESDVAVLDIWLRSLRDIAQVAFEMHIGDPQRVICSDQCTDLPDVLEKHVTPSTQMVLLLTPSKDSTKVYRLFKQYTTVTLPVITQVVKSETIRKRQNIAAVLSRIVLQINAKFAGPLWHIPLDNVALKPLFFDATMVVGIDVYSSLDGEQCMGFTASLNTSATEYYSMATMLPQGMQTETMALKIQEFFRDALLEFAKRNDGTAPQHVVVYRGSVNTQDWMTIRDFEVKAFNMVLDAMECTADGGDRPYKPALVFVVAAKFTPMRFYAPFCDKSHKNPEAGTIVDAPFLGVVKDLPSFYLISQAVSKGTVVPAHFTVLHDSPHVSVAAIENLTYRLCYLYFNCVAGVRLPAPLQYAKKLAEFIGTSVRAEPHKRLRRSFFYL